MRIGMLACMGLSFMAGAASIRIEPQGNLVSCSQFQVNEARAQLYDYSAQAPGQRGVGLKAGISSGADQDGVVPDLVLEITPAVPGRYVFLTRAAIDDEGAAINLKAKTKYDSRFLKLQIDGGRCTRRVVFTPWSPQYSCQQKLGKFALSEGTHQLKIWLPEHVRLESIEFKPYTLCKVPAEAASYVPSIVPPASHPRLWCNEDSVKLIRQRLTVGENASAWQNLSSNAKVPFIFQPAPGKEISYNTKLENACKIKAFYYLMTGDEKIGREAISLMTTYLSLVEFGNVLDITREMGHAVYTASLVFDWCHPLLSKEEGQILYQNCVRLAEDMECGWPPFGQNIVCGHGNEAQINRDLNSMAIAFYEINPIHYQHCSYLVLERLAPMRQFEYRSARHNQGSSYGQVRYGNDLHSAWLYRRMAGKPVFDPNFGSVYNYWLYDRCPDGMWLQCGDCWAGTKVFGTNPFFALLCYSYTNNPYYKYDYLRMGSKAEDMMFLLLNDPELKAAPSLEDLPLTCDCGPYLNGMFCRTGWEVSDFSNDVLTEFFAPDFHAGNHQHSDAGSFQIFLRGELAANLSQYKFYGTPYDNNFCKRSVAKSMLLVYAPEESFGGANIGNDGGSRFVRRTPGCLQDILQKEEFHYCKQLAASWGPSPKRPLFSYFASDLTRAYTGKIKSLVRRFCFLNLGSEQYPAAVVILDHLQTAKPEYQQFWQVNTFCKPQETADGVRMLQDGILPSALDVQMLLPAERTCSILSNEQTSNVFGKQYQPPRTTVEEQGHRIQFSPKQPSDKNTYLAVLKLTNGDGAPLQARLLDNPDAFVLRILDRVLVLPRTEDKLASELKLQLPDDGQPLLVFVAGLASGDWTLVSPKGEPNAASVEEGKTTLFFQGTPGTWSLRPGKATATALPAYAELVPAAGRPANGNVYLEGKRLPELDVRSQDGVALLPFRKTMSSLGCKFTRQGEEFLVEREGCQYRIVPATSTICLQGLSFPCKCQIYANECYVEAAAFPFLTGIGYIKDRYLDNYLFSTRHVSFPKNICWASTNATSREALLLLLLQCEKLNQFWKSETQNPSFDLVLAPNANPKAIAIAWRPAGTVNAKFAIETSQDGQQFTRVLEATGCHKAQTENFAFAPGKAKILRFTARENTLTKWNTLWTFQVVSGQ